jgi:putative membrane protein
MNTRKWSIYFLAAYALLVTYTTARLFLGLSFQPFFTPLLSLLAFVFALLHASQRLGWPKALLLLGLTFAVSLLFESVGVATGWVYGPYHYTDKLGPRFLGLVPLLIPVAWFMMTYPSVVIALRVTPTVKSTWGWRLLIAAIGGLAMTAWDLAMDPMMVAGGHWVWETEGAYFGIPVQNFWGWWLTTFVTFLLYLVISRATPQESKRLRHRFMSSVPPSAKGSNPLNRYERLAILSYAITGLSSILVDFRFGLGGPALVGIFAMLPWALLAWQELKR